MDSSDGKWMQRITWICPACQGSQKLQLTSEQMSCPSCGRHFSRKGDLIDFRILPAGEKSAWDIEKIEAAYREMGDYEDNFAWAAKDGWSREVEQYRHDRLKGRLLEWLKGREFSSILEIGCGSGYFLFQIEKVLKNPPKILCGLEVSFEQLLKFCSRLKRLNQKHGVPLLAASEKIPVETGSFDLVVSSEVIEHIEHPETAIQEIYRVLAPGGVFCLTTPSKVPTEFWKWFFQIPRMIRRALAGRTLRDMNKLEVYDQPLSGRQLQGLLEKSGFKVIRFERNIFLPHESYFPAFPNWMSDFFLGFGGFLEKWCPFLGGLLGLHLVAWAEKPKN